MFSQLVFKACSGLKAPFNCCRKNQNFAIKYRYPNTTTMMHFNLYCTDVNLQRFSLNEIRSMNFNHLEVSKEDWDKVVDEILTAKEKEKLIPQFLNMNNMYELLQRDSRSQRFRYLEFLFKKEKRRLSAIEKKRKKKTERQSVINDNVSEINGIQYGIGKNSLLLRLRRNSMIKFYNKRLANSVLFGQKFVIDLGYDEYMVPREKRNCAGQVVQVYSSNRVNSNPYDLYFCNAKFDSKCVKYIREEMPNIDESLVTLSEKSYLDFFPKENLVYLSPHSSKTLTAYDHTAVYIIGGFVDTVNRFHISLNKAQEEGIRSYSLPLDKYILWGTSTKSLSINQVFSIMQTFRDTGDWMEALKHVPTRKLRKLDSDSVEMEYNTDKLFLSKQ